MKFTLLFKSFFLFAISLCHLVYAMDCPSTVYVELGKDGIINCQILNNGDVYWYKGNSTKTSPIVRLENGQKKNSQESSRYDMDEERSLIIKDIEEQDYGLYSVVNFYASDKHDTDQIKVEIAVKPQTMCPIIAGCNNCNHCVLTESETGNISCSIGGTRPRVHLNIVTDSENLINVIQNISEETYDSVTDTWSTTATIQYSEWYDCRSPLHLRCVTKNKLPFELSDGVVHVKSDSCKTTTQFSGYQTPVVEDTKMIHVFAIAITIAVIFVVIVLVFGIVLCQKSGTFQNRKTNSGDMQMHGEAEPLQKGNTSSADVQSFINTLKNTYKTFRVFTSTPNGERIPIDDVFQGISFTLTKAGNVDNTIPSSEMITTLFGKERGFVFLDNGYYGRKAFMQYVCSSECAANLDENMMILCVNLKGLDRNMTIANAIDKQINLGETGSTDVIRNIMKNKKCLFVFDEVHELNQSPGDESTLNSKNKDPGEVTINDVLSVSHLFQEYQNVRSLCISKNNIDATPSFPKSQVNIRISPFTSKNLTPYVANVFSCYQDFDDTNTRKSSEETEGTVNNGNKDKSSVGGHTYTQKHAMCITNLILDEKNFINQIDMCPSLLILFTHTLVSDITKKAIDNVRFFIHRRSYLTRLILNCLEFQNCPSQAKYEDFELFLIKFGKASFEKSLEDTLFTETCDFISECTRRQLEGNTSEDDFASAFAMGILKLVTNKDCSKDVTDNLNPSHDSLIKFRHNYFQEYCAAQAIASNKTVNKRFLKSLALKKNDRMKRVLQFMHGTESQKRHEWLKQLVEEENWNNLIDCLFECENDDDFKKIKSALSPLMGKYTVNIIDMDQDYHGMAVARFCECLANCSISLEALTFRRPCELQYFSKLKIPEVKFLVFLYIDFQQGNDFIAFVKEACQMNVKEEIQFVRCECPTEIAKEEIEEIADLIKCSSNAPKIHRTDDFVADAHEKPHFLSKVQWYKLNLENGCWEKT